MRGIKSGLSDANEQSSVVVLKNTPHFQGLVKANRFLLLLASSLMVVVFLLGFLLLPADDVLDRFKVDSSAVSITTTAVENPVLSAEINTLKGQLVGLISGSIESKLRILETTIKSGSLNDSLGTIRDLRNDVDILRAYSVPEKKPADSQLNQALMEEVSQLKSLIYLTLSSCGLMVAAVAGFWVRNRYRLSHLEIMRAEEISKHK